MKKIDFFKKKVKPISSVISKQIGSKFYVLDPSVGKIYVLNEISALIWQCLSEGDSLEAVKKKILSEYSVEETKVLKDINDFIKRNSERDLLEIT